MSELLRRFFRRQQEIERECAIAKATLEAGKIYPDSNGHVLRASADGHRRDRARGIPIVGRVGGGGASPGTDPVATLLRKEARGEIRR